MSKFDGALIGMCLRDAKALEEGICRGVKPEMMVDPTLGAIWLTMTSLAAGGKPTDMMAIAAVMPDEAVRLFELVDAAPVAQSVAAYASAIVDAARDRDIYRALEAVKRGIELKHRERPWDGPKATDELLDQLFAKAMSHNSHASVKDAADVLAALETRWEHEHVHGSVETTVTTGFKSIDRQLNGGITKGAVMTIAAKTGEGKSMLAVNMAVRAALAGHRVLYVTIEMDAEELIERVIADYGDALYAKVIRTGRSSAEYDAFSRVARVIKSGMLSICDDSRGRIAEVERVVRYARATKPFDFVIVDYIQQFSPPGKQDRIIDRIREVSAFIKLSIAKPHNVAVLNIAQMNRQAEAEGRQGMRLGNIKESGAIEMDSDIVAMIAHENPDEPSPEAVASGLSVDGLAWLKFLKQRKGRRHLAVPLRFVGKHSRFEEIGDIHFGEGL